MQRFAENLARRVGTHIRGAAVSRTDAVTKAGAADWLTPLDGESEDHIRAAITDRYPDHGIIGEERDPQGDVERAPIVWHIDPIDGTTNFLYGLGNVSVSIAALDQHGPVVGVVHDVYRDQTISAARGDGLSVDGVRVAASEGVSTVTGEVVLTEWDGGFDVWDGMEDFLRWLASRHGVGRIIGSCALALAHAGLGRAAATILPGRYSSWDVAAGALIAMEGGCVLFDADGPAEGLPSDGLLVAHPQVADDVWTAWRRSVGSSR